MSEILAQNEIDAILQAAASGDVGTQGPEIQIFSRHHRDLDNVEIRDYDFKRPERISKDQMRALQTLHEAFGRTLGASLSGFLRTIVEVFVSQVEQMTYSEFIDGLPNPTSFNLIVPSTLEGQMCLELSPLIIYPIIDRLMGGSNQDLFIPQRPMTAIEIRLISQILDRAMAGLAEAWGAIVSIEFTLGDMESNPQLVQIVPPNEVVVVIRFELKMGKRAGTMSLCIPFNVIDPVMEQLEAQSWFSSPLGKSETWSDVIEDRLGDAGMNVAANLAETTITLRDLQSLEIGDLIMTNKPADGPLVVCIEGHPKYLAEIGQIHGSRAVQIKRPIGVGDRI